MPQIRYMSWNIQDFGQGTAKYSQLKGANSVWLAEFIARMAVRAQIDVIGIMEVKPTAQPHLDSVLFALNNRMGVTDWCYDYVKGSVGITNALIDSPAKTTWRSGQISPRQEGYAFFWRNGSANFRMMEAQYGMSEGGRNQVGYNPAYVPGNAVSLSLLGRDSQPHGHGNGFPRPTSNFNPAAIGPFVGAYYPDTSKGIGSWVVYWDNVRRPAYVVLYLQGIGGGDANRAVPLMLYHAPSNATLANLGVFLGGLAAELYALPGIVNNQPTGALFHPSKSIASGDYNARVDGAYNYADCYYTFYKPFAAVTLNGNPAGGQNGTPCYDNTNPVATTVQLNQFVAGRFTGPPITSANNNNYTFSSIDDMFHRGITLHAPGRCYVWDLLQDVRGVNANIAAGIQAYFAGVNGIANGAAGISANTGPHDVNNIPLYKFFNSGVNDWNTFITDLNAGRFTTARGAAEFVRMFVSDHLPLVIEFDVV
jgi:hypothetical protein